MTTGITLAHFDSIAQQNSMTAQERLTLSVADFLNQQLAGDQSNDLSDNLTIDVTPVDSRINIPECNVPFSYDVDPATLHLSYLNVRVSCDSNDWYLFTSAKVTRTRTIVVTASMISPDTVLSDDHLTLAEVDIKRLRHTPFTTLEDVTGARLKYRVREGQPVQSNMLCFICKGDRITISAQAGTMEVKTSGIARQDGVIGDVIEVVNSSSNKSIIAKVASTQEVVVSL
ncbi:flagellar basal body P-ring formation chaperone FlgA [Alteromonas gilva]|uniref:Flagella basal body P-ring formation protein FlgA n=1 Tax=Alteromonas gilva TaxID=2987522 RepID=A0ABT5L090_9ALTE|nr:flagellar basal body P-ring formation chaperone FlgA [Alteromonas gilva]MDC8830433.1 flagellar basal body P-ring formation chaperone FlgA [Alteromonas gilva]